MIFYRWRDIYTSVMFERNFGLLAAIVRRNLSISSSHCLAACERTNEVPSYVLALSCSLLQMRLLRNFRKAITLSMMAVSNIFVLRCRMFSFSSTIS